MSSGGLSPLRALLRELRPLDTGYGRVARTLLPSQTRQALTGGVDESLGDQVFRNSILHRPQPPPRNADIKAANASFSDFRLNVRRHLRRPEVTLDSPDLASATLALYCASARLPLPSCERWEPHTGMSSTSGFETVSNANDVKPGDLLVAHPGLTEEGLGGCVAMVLRHSEFDTLCLVMNVDAGVNATATWKSPAQRQRPPFRLHVHLPPIAPEDPRQMLPEAMQKIPLRWGGGHPTPLHLLHTMPLVDTTRHQATYQRLTGHEVYPGLWCSYVDEAVLQAVSQKLQDGEAKPSDFGAFVGMMCMEPGRLENYMIQNHWFVVRPREESKGAGPHQGWGGTAWSPDGRWMDDRQWAPWRSILSDLGGEFADWADVDWVSVMHKSSASTHWRTAVKDREPWKESPGKLPELGGPSVV